MNGHHRTICEVCGQPVEMGKRKRLLGQRERTRGRFCEDGWQLYGHPDCIDRAEELLGMLAKMDRGE